MINILEQLYGIWAFLKYIFLLGIGLNIIMYIFFYTKRYKKPEFWKGAKPTLIRWIIYSTVFFIFIESLRIYFGY